MSPWEAVLAYVVGPGIIACGTILVARRAGRSSDKAAATSADVAREANAIDGFDRLVKSLEKRLDDQGDRLSELEREVRRLRDERRANRALIRRLWRRLQAALVEIRHLEGNVPPAAPGDDEQIALILDGDT